MPSFNTSTQNFTSLQEISEKKRNIEIGISHDNYYIETLTFQILEGVDEFSNILQKKEKSKRNPDCSFWVDAPSHSKDVAFDSFEQFWEEGFLTDLTLLVGPYQVAVRAHKVILSARFEYFRSMFSLGFKESSSAEVCLPFIGPEDLRLLLKYAYRGDIILTKKNVFKMAVMANYFGCDILLDKGCEFIKQFTDVKTCLKLLEAAFQMDIIQLRKNCILFIVDHLPEVNQDDLSALPVEPLLEIIQHPAAMIDIEDSAENEEKLFHLIWTKVQSCPPERKNEFVLKVLKAIHLPVTGKYFLFFLLSEVDDIREARDLIMKAGKMIDPKETREWYLRRFHNSLTIMVLIWDNPLQVNGITTDEYSMCVLIKGFPFFIYVTSAGENKSEKDYHVESPVAIEHLGLPYEVIVQLKLYPDSEWVTVNTYRNGIVDKCPIRDEEQDKEDYEIEVMVTFHSK